MLLVSLFAYVYASLWGFSLCTASSLIKYSLCSYTNDTFYDASHSLQTVEILLPQLRVFYPNIGTLICDRGIGVEHSWSEAGWNGS